MMKPSPSTAPYFHRIRAALNKSAATLGILTACGIILLAAGCASVPVPPPLPNLSSDGRFVLEVINPRTEQTPLEAYVTTLYLIRNISKEILLISGGPRFEWKTPRESGATTPMTDQIKLYALKPGQACAVTAETWFGKYEEFPVSVSLFHGDLMSFQTVARARGLQYRAVFIFSYRAAGQTVPVTLNAPWIQVTK